MSDQETAPTPEKGTEEYNEQMSDRFEQGFSDEKSKQSFEAEIAAMPDAGSEKFYNADTGEYDWESHSKELQFKLEQKPAEEQSTPPNETAPAENSEFWTGVTSSIESEGTINEDNYKKLIDFGIPSDVLDDYVDLLSIGKEYAQSRTVEYAGGEQSLNAMFDWASTNLTEEEIGNYNNILDTPNWRMAIDSLKVASGIGAVDSEASPESPQLVEGQFVSDSGTGFASRQEMVTAMGDPKYKNDPAFRNQVRLRVGNSNF